MSVNAMSLGMKYDDKKRRYSLLPSGVVNDVVDVLEFGARKYAVDNWKHVDNGYVRYYDAALRHIDAWYSGERYDDDSKQHHLAHAICCLMFLLWKDKNE